MMTLLRNWLGFGQRQHSAGASSTIDMFLSGASIPAVSAAYAPGVGGPDLLLAQRAIEQQLRQFIFQLEDEIAEMKEALDACEG